MGHCSASHANGKQDLSAVLRSVGGLLANPEVDLPVMVERLRQQGWRVLFLPWGDRWAKWECVWWAREAPVDCAGMLIANEVLTPAERLALLVVWAVELAVARAVA